MHYIPKSGAFNAFNAITILSNIPSILVLVLVPYLLPSGTHFLLNVGFVFMVYRFGNILGASIAPKIASQKKPHLLSSMYECGNAIVSALILVALIDGFINLYHLSSLFFLKGMLGGLHSNTRFQWLKNLSTQTEVASKIIVYTGAIVQAAFGIGGLLLLLHTDKNISFYKFIFFGDILTSVFAAALFFKLKSLQLPKSEPLKKSEQPPFWRNKILIPLYIADIFIALAVAGTNMLIFKFGTEIILDPHGHAMALVIYSFGFITGSIVINEFKTKKFRPIWLLLFFTLACGGMYYFTYPLNIALYLLFFFLYPLLLLGLEKEWFENLSQDIAARVYAIRFILLSILWALGEVLYANQDWEQVLRMSFLSTGLVILCVMEIRKKAISL